jgi:hypothetical protein
MKRDKATELDMIEQYARFLEKLMYAARLDDSCLGEKAYGKLREAANMATNITQLISEARAWYISEK